MVNAAPNLAALPLPSGAEFFCTREVAAHFVMSPNHLAILIEDRALKGCVDLRCSKAGKATWRIPKYSLITFMNFRNTKIMNYKFDPDFARRFGPERQSFRLLELAALLRCSKLHLFHLIQAGDLDASGPVSADTKRSTIRISRDGLLKFLNGRLNS